ncbi:MAG: hypothetical protein IVW57_00120 [Ktedonobacterales bacterium]|nr:hypothetical protein [Ktedonobacterales bacterium]
MISPWQVGQTLPVWTPTWTYDNGSPVNLTGATLSLLIVNVTTGVVLAGAGTFTVVNGSLGQAQYAWATADCAEPGQYVLIAKATFAGGGVLPADPVPWLVKLPGQ